MENINDNFIKLTENIDSNYKKIKNILIDDIHKLDNKIFNKTFIIILNYFKNYQNHGSKCCFYYNWCHFTNCWGFSG